MRYFEIARPPARHILADADQRDAAGEPRSGRLKRPMEIGVRKQLESVRPTLQFCQGARPT